jgi:hypothetical protein
MPGLHFATPGTMQPPNWLKHAAAAVTIPDAKSVSTVL